MDDNRKVTVEEWVAALRSGNYEQTRQFLRREDGYCCLGVLCDLVNPEAWQNAAHNELGWLDLPSAVRYSFFIPRAIFPNGINERIAEQLASANDKGLDFNAIADLIEAAVRGEDLDELIQARLAAKKDPTGQLVTEAM